MDVHKKVTTQRLSSLFLLTHMTKTSPQQEVFLSAKKYFTFTIHFFSYSSFALRSTNHVTTILFTFIAFFHSIFIIYFFSYFRPKSGSMLLYSRKKVRYRRDGYCWKKRKDGKTTREDHMKLKVQGTEVSARKRKI